jgi:hypothetical protein
LIGTICGIDASGGGIPGGVRFRIIRRGDAVAGGEIVPLGRNDLSDSGGERAGAD